MSNKITVTSAGTSVNVNVTPDSAMYYSNKAREWAISNRIVDGVDYSSKYYALNAQSYAQSALETLNNVDNKVQEATENIENLSEQEQNKIIDLGIDTRADVDLSNLSSVGEKHFLNKTQITNCLLEVPQRVKLELNDGTLTLKAGSQVIVPNGFEEDGVTPRFDYVTIETDFTIERTVDSNNWFLFYDRQNNKLTLQTPSQVASGTSDTFSELDYHSWYDTGANLVKNIRNSVIDSANCSLPLCLFTSTQSVGITSLNQVFNGLGYMGSTVWIDKGVKGLIPNGRNEDGTLRNIEYTTSKITTNTRGNWGQGDEDLVITVSTLTGNANFAYSLIEVDSYNDILTGQNGTLYIIKSENIMYYKDSNNNIMQSPTFVLGNAHAKSTKITSFQPKQPFRAVDYSDSSEVSGWGMPSGKSIDLTLGASGSRYTAPANGWFYLQMAYVADKYIDLWNSTTDTGCIMSSASSTASLRAMTPCRKGDIIQVNYSATTQQVFRFIYAEGEV